MGAIPKNSIKASLLTKKPTTKSSRRLRRAQRSINNKSNGGGGNNRKCSLSDKLEELRSLIPIAGDGGDRADRLFQETADYILKLRSQVFLLQSLVELYGSTGNNNSGQGGGDNDSHIVSKDDLT